MFNLRSARRATLAATVFGGIVLSACDSLLEVDNPGAISEDDVTDTTFLPHMVNAVVNEFQREFGFWVFAGAILSDEAVNGHNFEQWQRIDLRQIEDDNSQILTLYTYIQRARGTGDEMVSRIRPLVDEQNSMQLATALAYSGYSYIYLAEFFCFAPIHPEGEAIRSDAIAAHAVEQLAEAAAIAGRNTGAEAARIRNLALVGAARAAMLQDKKAEAISFAQQVPADFTAWVRFVESPTSRNNYLNSATTGTNRTVGVDAAFRGLNDNRIRYNPVGGTGHNQRTILFTPYQSSSFGEWTAGGDDVVIGQATPIRLASGLEARYIIAEMGGMSEGDLRAFIDARRAVGGQPAFEGTDLQAELREQRRRDFFLDGHRLGDLRRYRTRYGIDMFPTGPHPNDAQWAWGSYDTGTCFIPHRNEGIANRNYKPLPLD